MADRKKKSKKRKTSQKEREEIERLKHRETFYEQPPPGSIKENDERPEDCIPDLPENREARKFLAEAPSKGLWMPLGKEVKVMKCWRCKAYGHRTGDRECPMFISGNMSSEKFRIAHEDPMYEVIKANKKEEKEKRVALLKALLEETTTSECDSDSDSIKLKKKHKKKSKKSKDQKRHKAKKQKLYRSSSSGSDGDVQDIKRYSKERRNDSRSSSDYDREEQEWHSSRKRHNSRDSDSSYGERQKYHKRKHDSKHIADIERKTKSVRQHKKYEKDDSINRREKNRRRKRCSSSSASSSDDSDRYKQSRKKSKSRH